MRFYLLVIFFTIALFQYSTAQRFGGTPSSQKWKQINTDTVRIIFPAGCDSAAQRIAALAHAMQHNNSSTIGSHIHKINIVLQKDATVSNGYVSLGPWRSEFYLMPPQDAFELGAQSWQDNLAIHEFRHVEQYSNFNTGAAKAMSILFGQNGQALANAAAVPDWFFEGDAVFNETLLSEQGRGRLPFFFNGYKSLYDAKKQYSFMQLRNGSLKNYIPDHYQLGYLLVAYGREKYGDDFWKKVTQDAAGFKPLFYPLQGAIKKHARVDYNQFVKNAFAFYHAQWQQHEGEEKTEWLTATEKNNVVSYRYPYTIADGSIIALKSSRKEIPAFCILHEDESEERIAVRDIAYDDYFSYNNGKIIYSAYETDVRWGNRDYSIIKLLDVATGETKKISHHTKYFSPDISHSGSSIVAAEVLSPTQSSIVLLNNAGEVVNHFSNNEHYIYSYPKFSADDKNIFTVVRNLNGEMGIQKINISSGNISFILPIANRVIGFPVVKGDTVLYSCSANGSDEIWCYIESKNKNYKLASYYTGLYQATINNAGSLVASAFTVDGYRLAKINAEWKEVTASDTLSNLYVTKPFNASDNNFLNTTSISKYPISQYHKAHGLFNFHSWVPYLEYPDYSFNIYGENVLNTFQSQVYYTYNRNEKYHRAGYTGTYGGWYVQPIFDVNHTWNRNLDYNADTTVYWNELNTAVGLQLPLNFSGGKQYKNLKLLTTFNVDQLRWTGIGKNFLRNLNFSYVQARLQYAQQMKKAAQQIFPHFGYSALLQYRGIVNKYTAHQMLASASLYLPGFAGTHSIVLNAAYQSRDTAGQYYFTNNFPFARGYDAPDFPRMWKFGVNYHLPLLLPDWGFANIVFFNRIRANIFYDYNVVRSLSRQTNFNYRSAGAEIYFDTRWWNQQAVTFGIRYSRLLDENRSTLSLNQWEIILPVAGLF